MWTKVANWGVRVPVASFDRTLEILVFPPKGATLPTVYPQLLTSQFQPRSAANNKPIPPMSG
jgi:hypothetical protein